MPLANDPVACVSATAASLAEISSSARKRSETRYSRPVIRKALVGCCDVASGVATTMASGLSSGISVTAVSTLSVLAGPNSPCGSLAASTWPVLAFAMTHAEAGMSGTGLGPSDGSFTTIPLLAISGPPILRAAWPSGVGPFCCVVSSAAAGRVAGPLTTPESAETPDSARKAGSALAVGQAMATSAAPMPSAASLRAT
jgi:hypothetical protein